MTLTELSYYSRKFTPLGIIGVLFLLIIFYVVKIIISIPPAPPPPPGTVTNIAFGKIKSPQISEATTSAQFSITIDTLTGRPIEGPPTAKVFFMPVAANPNVGYQQTVKNMAKAAGMDPEKATLDRAGAMFTFIEDRQKLDVDITNYNFKYTFEVSPEDEFFSTVTIPSETEIKNKAGDFFRAMGRYPDELAKGKLNIVYLSYNLGTRELTINKDAEGANMVEVDFYRPDLETLPVVSPNYFNSQHYVIMAFHKGGVKIIRSQVQFYDMSTETVGIYPLKTGDTAWKQLQEGKGLVTFHQPDSKEVVIKEMFLAYLDPEGYQEYLQPVYVFLGDVGNNFVAYVPAIDDSQLQP